MRTTVGLLCLVSGLAGCGSHDTPHAGAPPMQVEDTAFGDMTGTMGRARSVEGTTLQHKEDLDRAVEQDGG
jgi:hypothetical protein